MEIVDSDLSPDDLNMIYYGILIGVDDNLTFGIGQWANNTNYLPKDNYYFMRAKTFTDTAFVAFFAQAALGSASAAATFLANSGRAALCAAATSPTGIGTAVFGNEAVGELAAAGFCAGISILTTTLSERSYNILNVDMIKLSSIPRWYILKGLKTRNVVEKTAEEANVFWANLEYPPYKSNTKVFEFDLTEQTKFVRVYKEGFNTYQGQWFMKAEDIKGLTPEQIADRFGLQYIPDKISEVTLNADTRIRGGIASEVTAWVRSGGGIQFDLMKKDVGAFNPLGDLSVWLSSI